MAGKSDTVALAEICGTLFKALLEQGFTREEAVQLTAAWLQGYCTR